MKINVIDDKFVRSNFPKRENNSQKGDYGKVLVIAGSAGMTGAAYLSSQTAVTTGSGLVTLAVPSSLNSAMEAKTTEVMTVPLSDRNGRISAGAIDEILKRVDKADTVLIGPGLGRCDDVSEVVESVLEYSKSSRYNRCRRNKCRSGKYEGFKQLHLPCDIYTAYG